MKKLLFILGILSISAHSQIDAIKVKYDVEDNVILIHGNWVTSWDYNWNQPANDIVGVSAYSISGNYMVVQSKTKKIGSVFPVGFYGPYKIKYSWNRKKAVIYYPQLAYHIDHAELFKFKILFGRPKLQPFCKCRNFKNLKHRHVQK